MKKVSSLFKLLERAGIRKMIELLTPRQRRGYILILVMSLLVTVLDLFGLAAAFYFMTLLVNKEKILEYPFLKDIFNFLGIYEINSIIFSLCLSLVILYLFKTIYYVVFTKVQIDYNQNLGNGIIKKLFKRYISNEYRFHINNNSSDLLKVVTDMGTELMSNYVAPLSSILSSLIILFSISFTVIYLDPISFLIMLGMMSLFTYIFIKKTDSKMKRYGEERNVIFTKKNKIILESFASIREVKLLNREKKIIDKYNSYMDDLQQRNIYIALLSSISSNVLEFLVVFFVMSFVFISLYLGYPSHVIIARLAVVGLAAMRLFPIVVGMNNSFLSMRYGKVALDRIYHDLVEDSKSVDASQKRGDIEAYFSNEIRFEDVNFSYEKKRVLKNLNLVIPKNKNIAFVGPSGAGKSTTVDILLGLLEPEQGKILLDNISISQYKNYNCLFGYIPQQIYLSDTSIAKNIAYFLDENEIDFHRVNQVLKLVELYDFVQDLPEKEHTEVGERGVRLSGGQRQRIGIARAMYHNPSILVMDEATAALDNITEAKIIKTIQKLQNKTVIFVAHRLSTIEHCDIIYVMDEGKLVDSGNYDELCKRSPLFKKMLNKLKKIKNAE